MSPQVLSDVFTPGEVARAANADVADVRALIASPGVRTVGDGSFLSGADALRIARELRQRTPAARPARGRRTTRLPALASGAVHLCIACAVLWLSAGPEDTAAAAAPASGGRLVFILSAGPGGGGGGGGLRNPRPAPPVERRQTERLLPSVPATTPEPVATTARREETPPVTTPPPTPDPEPVPDPLPSRALVAPVVSAASEQRDRDGVIDPSAERADSGGPGTAGGAGTGRGAGNGAGEGSGIGTGAGGGTGGGPYRPGSGVTPPRLLREVKATYTEDARRRGITGEVVLEIVVRRDGTVGAVTIGRGLDAGLDQRAVAAVRQWRFEPSRLNGSAVDVIVEVAVEFTLR